MNARLNDAERRAAYEARLEVVKKGRGGGAIVQAGLNKDTMGRFHKLAREMAQVTLEQVGQAWGGTTAQAVAVMETGKMGLTYDKFVALEGFLGGRSLMAHLPKENGEPTKEMRERLLRDVATLEEVVAYRVNESAENGDAVRVWLHDALKWHGISQEVFSRLVDWRDCAQQFISNNRRLPKFRIGETERIVECLEKYVQHDQSREDAFWACSRRQNDWVRQRVRLVRQMKSMTDVKIGGVLGVSQPFVARYENDSAARKTYLHRHHAEAVIAHLRLEVTPEELFLPEEDAVGRPVCGPREGLPDLLKLTDEEKRAYVANRHMPKVLAWVRGALAESALKPKDVGRALGIGSRVGIILRGGVRSVLKPGELEMMAGYFACRGDKADAVGRAGDGL